jgi:hypothetical protein
VNVLRTLIDGAVADAIAEHPKYFTPKGQEKARAAIVRKIMAAFREDGDDKPDEEVAAIDPNFVFVDPQSREARGYINLRRISGASAPVRSFDGKVPIKASAHKDSVFALADLPPREHWPFLTTPAQIGAWMEFFRETLGETPRRAIAEMRNGMRGIVMPGYWPPRKDGQMYDTPEAA